MKNKNSEKTAASQNDKILVSFYLSSETLEEVDDLIFHLKKQLPMDKRRKLTKSIFYEASLKILLEGYKTPENGYSLLKVINELMRS